MALDRIYNGQGNTGDMYEKLNSARTTYSFHYIVHRMTGTTRGQYGGNYPFEIWGTNDRSDLLSLDFIRGGWRTIDTKADSIVRPEDLAAEYVASLEEVQKANLVNDMLAKFVLGK